jgi:hypothetical protein
MGKANGVCALLCLIILMVLKENTITGSVLQIRKQAQRGCVTCPNCK